jgi:hypothetical protein
MATLTCLIDHIGVDGCDQDAPPSGIYINELPGIELKMIDKIADADQVNFLGVWSDVQKRAARRFVREVNAEFNQRYKLKTLTQSVNIGKVIGSTVTAPATNYNGGVLELEREENDYVNSNLQVITIQYLNLYAPIAGSTTVKIWDLDTEEELFSLVVAATAGWNRVSVLSTFTARRIYYAFDATNIGNIDQDISKHEQAVKYNNDYYYCNFEYQNGNIELRGASSTIADKFTLTYESDAYGISPIFSVGCSYESLICNNLSVFENAFWYLLGIELLTERLNTSRLNEFTVGNTAKIQELKNEFTKMYYGGADKDGAFRKGELNLAIEGINLNKRDICLECNDQFIYADAKL